MITADELGDRLVERPFRPFRLHLTDGRHFDIIYPTWHMAAEPFLIVGLPPEDDPTCRFAGERSVWVPYKLIDRIEPLAAAVATTQ